LFEYEEVLTMHLGQVAAVAVIETIINNQNTLHSDAYYKWNLIENDPDDNKFVDCALAANAQFIVSEDRHFEVLKKITFPKVELLKIEEFKEILINFEDH
jgi:predicted nucleic acid-binding protein